jgi:DNA polymerase sigma
MSVEMPDRNADSPKIAAASAGSEDDAKAKKRAEIERKVSEARAKQQADKEMKEKAAREQLALEQEKEARKQSQIQKIVQEAISEKDAEFARKLAAKDEELQQQRIFLQKLQQSPLETIKESKVIGFSLVRASVLPQRE